MITLAPVNSGVRTAWKQHMTQAKQVVPSAHALLECGLTTHSTRADGAWMSFARLE